MQFNFFKRIFTLLYIYSLFYLILRFCFNFEYQQMLLIYFRMTLKIKYLLFYQALLAGSLYVMFLLLLLFYIISKI